MPERHPVLERCYCHFEIRYVRVCQNKSDGSVRAVTQEVNPIELGNWSLLNFINFDFLHLRWDYLGQLHRGRMLSTVTQYADTIACVTVRVESVVLSIILAGSVNFGDSCAFISYEGR